MQLRLIVAALAAGLASAALVPAHAQRSGPGTSVRNEADVALTCRIYREGRARHETVVLRAGQEWRDEPGARAPRALYCDPPAAAIRYRLQAGAAYRLVPESRSVRIVLRAG